MIFIRISLLLTLFSLAVNAQQPKEEIKWMTLEEAVEASKKQPRKIYIDFYTHWCGPCKMMLNNTFKNPTIAAYLNNNYYPVKFDAEGPDTIVFLTDTFMNPGYNPLSTGRNSTHELTKKLAPSNGRIAYPTSVYLDEEFKIISAIPGYLAPNKLQPILIYFAENIHKMVPYDMFDGFFNETFYDTTGTHDSLAVKWYSLEEAVELCKKEPRKIFVHLFTEWSLTSQMMYKTTYEHPLIAAYLNEHFYPVLFNGLSADSVEFNGQVFTNPKKEHPFHNLAVTFLNGRMTFPANVYIDNNFTVITAVPGYQAPVNIEPIMKFFEGDFYKKMKWEDYITTFKTELKADTPVPGQ